MQRWWMVSLVALSSCLPPAGAIVVQLAPTADNTLYESEPGNLSNGSGQYLFAGTTEGGFLRRGLIRFDIASAVPAGATILSAELRLHMSRTPTASEMVGLHRVLADWGEGTSRAFGQEGGGAPATPGDATWQHAFYPIGPWSTPGGHFDLDPSATRIVTGIGDYTWSGPQLAMDTQSWLDAPAGDFGWLLLGDETLVGTAKRFDSREHANPQVRPVLTVDYVIPEPSSIVALMVLWALGSLRRLNQQDSCIPHARRHLEER